MKAAGIDIGSQSAKAVILKEDGGILASCIVSTSADGAESSAELVLNKAMTQARLTSIEDLYVVAVKSSADPLSLSQQQKALTTCLARGVFHSIPGARMVIDMGAESSTVLKVSPKGKVTDWANHDKCASGTGMFLQQMAKIMKVSIDEMSEISASATGRASITNTCAVFAESEVISHIHRQPPTPRADIVAGINASVTSRIMGLCKRLGIQKEVAVTGGVALNRGLIGILEEEIGLAVVVPEQPQTVAALGAAILARESMEKEGIQR